jgi:sulfite reductase alpha subunit-like flavoprotein
VPFRPPVDNAAPMVMICAGTGLAPFRFVPDVFGA